MSDALAILSSIDMLLLTRVSGAAFRCLGTPPDWCDGLWSADEERSADDVFPFLEVFLRDAEAAWAVPTRIDSETWTQFTEQGDQIHLQATALRANGQEVLLVVRCEALHHARQLLLQRARELRLLHDLAARAAEHRDVLIHCIIHELQDPLSTLLNAIGQLHDGARSPNESRLAATALDAAQRQRQLILDILQIFAGERSAAGATELVSVVDSVMRLFVPVALARGQSLVWDPSAFGAAGLTVVGDAQRLERVVSNLVENAVSNAISEVTVQLQRDGGDACLIVEDDGPPLPADGVPHLFEKLGSGDRGEGAGLRLYFCRITVERWGGSIGYEPRRANGKRFWLKVPIAN